MISERIIDGAQLEKPVSLEVDVAIVGTGAGGGLAAEILSQAGLKVAMIEEGPYYTSESFDMTEAFAYPHLYQESASRQTKDKAIQVLQGRCVGGTTTVNWTSSFRTPEQTLKHWQSHFQVEGLTTKSLDSWFTKMEQRLSISPWQVPPNPNNAVIAASAKRLGYEYGVISRNVRGCLNIGYCGVGCPVDAKQSMLVTCIPEALRLGSHLLHRVRVENLTMQGERVVGISGVAMDDRGNRSRGVAVNIRARHVILSAGAIGSPAVLLRSEVPDPSELTGKRTFLHPTVISAARMVEEIRPYEGAPQSLYSDHFLWRDGVEGDCGFKLEVPPIHPVLMSTITPFFGREQHEFLKMLPNLQVMIALCRDGFHPESVGGTTLLKPDGSPVLDYPISSYLWKGIRKALLAMAEMQFAAGAKHVTPLHMMASPKRSWKAAKAHIEALSMAPLKAVVGSAHVMGGCPMGENKATALVNSHGEHHHAEGLSVYDGSLFPTSLGANPQLSIYGIIAKLATRLARNLS